MFRREERARDFECEAVPGGYLSGWYFDCNKRNSRRSVGRGMLNGEDGGGPCGRVVGKRV